MIKACLFFDQTSNDWKEEVVGHFKWIAIKLTFAWVDDGNNEAVNAENTSHDTGNERLEDQARPENTNGADPDAGSRGAVSSPQVCKNKGGSEPKEAPECRLVDRVYGKQGYKAVSDFPERFQGEY